MFKKKYYKSLKIILIVIFLVLGLIPSLILRVGFLKLYEDRAVSTRSIDILSQAKILANQISTYDFMNDTSSEVIQAELEQMSNIYDGRVLIIDDTFRVIRDTYNLDENKTIISEEVVESFRGEEISKYDSDNGYIEMTIPIADLEDKSQILGVMLVSVSTDSVQLNLNYLRNGVLIIEICIIMAVMLFAVLASSQLVKPFGKLRKSIAEVQAGYGKNEVNINAYMETEQISDALNKLLSRMKVIDDSRQEFVSNVSHELKTPLTSMKVLADSLNGQDDVPMELYKEFMADIGNEIERENKIINDLLSLVKMDKSAADLNIGTVNINDLLEQILKRLRPIADKQGIELVLESFRPVSAEIDEVKLTLAFTNLIENGIKYNKEHGWVHVSLNADHQYFYVKVEDTGIGIPEDSLEHIYERFYRVDKSHSREIGGTGLGLAITRNAVLMHRGAIKAHSVIGEGTLFTVRIPMNYIA